jgi:hypothetical protein
MPDQDDKMARLTGLLDDEGGNQLPDNPIPAPGDDAPGGPTEDDGGAKEAAKGFDLDGFFDKIGVNDEDDDFSLLDKVDEKFVSNLGSESKTLLRKVRNAARQKTAAREKELEERAAALEAREKELDRRRQTIDQRHADTISMFGGKDVRERIRKNAKVDTSKIDLTKPGGVDQLVEAKLAQRMSDFLKPVMEEGDKVAKRQTLDRLKAEIPDFSKPEFQKEVAAELRRLKAAGKDITGQLENIARRVEVKRYRQQQRDAEAARRQAAAKSASHQVRNPSNSGNSKYEAVPQHIRRAGGVRLRDYLRDHPKAAAAVAYKQKNGRWPPGI